MPTFKLHKEKDRLPYQRIPVVRLWDKVTAPRIRSVDGGRSKNQRLDATARCLAAACLIAVIFGTFRLFNGADTPFLAFSVVGAAVLHLANRPCLIEAAITAVLASGLGLTYVGSRGIFGQYPGSGLIGTIAFLGLASMLVLGAKACLSTAALRPLLLATLCPALVIVTNVALAAIIQFEPRVFDLFLYRF
jgi:hypothetical protein